MKTISDFLRNPATGGSSRARKDALVKLNDAELTGVSGGQGPTVIALPYLYTNTGQIQIVPNYTVVPAPPPSQVAGLSFGSLIGGGLASAFGTGPGAAGVATFLTSVHKLGEIKRAESAINLVKQAEADGLRFEQKSPVCLRPTTMTALHHGGAHFVKPEDAGSCTLQQQQDANDTQQELDDLMQEGDATQAEIEGAEEAAETAEEALQAAEIAGEALADGLDACEGLLDLLDLF